MALGQPSLHINYQPETILQHARKCSTLKDQYTNKYEEANRPANRQDWKQWHLQSSISLCIQTNQKWKMFHSDAQGTLPEFLQWKSTTKPYNSSLLEKQMPKHTSTTRSPTSPGKINRQIPTGEGNSNITSEVKKRRSLSFITHHV